MQIKTTRQWHPTPVLLPGKSHGWRGLVGCSPWGREELDMTERLHFHFSLSCIGEENGNPLQCSCLENPRDGGPGGLPSMGSHRVEHDWSDLAAAWRIFRWIHEIVTVVTSWKEHWRMKSTEWERNLLSKYLQRWITYVQICISENTIKPMSMK